MSKRVLSYQTILFEQDFMDFQDPKDSASNAEEMQGFSDLVQFFELLIEIDRENFSQSNTKSDENN